MRTITKSTAYSKLKEIKESGIDTNKYLRDLVNSDSVPYNVLIFINKYSPIEQLYTYNKIHENRRKNPLYKNIVNENAEVEDMALALSSILTQTLIHAKDLSEIYRTEYYSIMNTDLILEALSSYTINNDSKKLTEIFLGIRDVFKNLYR